MCWVNQLPAAAAHLLECSGFFEKVCCTGDNVQPVETQCVRFAARPFRSAVRYESVAADDQQRWSFCLTERIFSQIRTVPPRETTAAICRFKSAAVISAAAAPMLAPNTAYRRGLADCGWVKAQRTARVERVASLGMSKRELHCFLIRDRALPSSGGTWAAAGTQWLAVSLARLRVCL